MIMAKLEGGNHQRGASVFINQAQGHKMDNCPKAPGQPGICMIFSCKLEKWEDSGWCSFRNASRAEGRQELYRPYENCNCENLGLSAYLLFLYHFLLGPNKQPSPQICT